MKYIRTRDGIFEFAKRFNLEHYRNVGFSDEDIVRKFIRNGNKIADTIEELCDEFVLGKTECQKPCVSKLPLDFLKECVITKTGYNLVVYGSIWVDNNLIKAAKMNDKGELELL